MTGPGRSSSPGVVQELLLRHARSAPERLAIIADDARLTYGELADWVSRAAAGMISAGVEGGDRVLVSLPNSAAFVVMALAAMRIGAAFVPVSPEEAPARFGQIVADCEPALVVAHSGHAVSRCRAGVPVKHPRELVLGGEATGTSSGEGDAHERIVYMIYTSGTSGSPKGVQIPVRALLAAITATADGLGLDQGTRSLCVSPFHFDGSYATVFPTLLRGGTLVIPDRKDLLFLKRFFRVIREEGVTHAAFSPSYLSLLLKSPQMATLAAGTLQSVGIGGEELVAKDLLRLWEAVPGLRIYNYYGPTEATIETTTHLVGRESLVAGQVPLGRPHRGVRFHLVSEVGALIDAPDQVGELCISGEQLMAGYWRDELLTAAVLRHDVVPGRTVYRTGDLARFNQEGLYFFMGRRDELVKRRGVRMSLTEVSGSLMKVDGVIASVCLAVKAGVELEIWAFVVTEGCVEEQTIFNGLDDLLPHNMHPDRLVIVDGLPTTDRGKIDRDALLALYGLDCSENSVRSS